VTIEIDGTKPESQLDMWVAVEKLCQLAGNIYFQGARPPGKLEKSGNLIMVREIRKSQGSCGLPVICYHSCDSHNISIT